MRRDYAESLECTVIIRDIAERNNIRDIPLLDVLFAWAVKNASGLISVQSAVSYLRSLGRKVSYDTAALYLGYLESAFLIFRVRRCSIRSGQSQEETQSTIRVTLPSGTICTADPAAATVLF